MFAWRDSDKLWQYDSVSPNADPTAISAGKVQQISTFRRDFIQTETRKKR